MAIIGQHLRAALGLVLVCAASCGTETQAVAPPGDHTDAGLVPFAEASGPTRELCAYASEADGPYCARSLLIGSPDNELYECAGGITVRRTTCAGRCTQGADGMPGGGDDACDDGGGGIEQQPTAQPPEQQPRTTAAPPQAADDDPCAAARFGDARYCLRTLEPSAKGTDLYHCLAGKTVAVVPCAGGCQVMPPGGGDACVGEALTTWPAADPCRNARLGDGGYCAKSLDPSSTSPRLYTCIGRATAAVTVCPLGCRVMPDGINDVCAGGSTSPPIVPSDSGAIVCEAKIAGDCGTTNAYCASDGSCKSCALGKFNCNGTYACECKYGCNGSGCMQCSAKVAFACDGTGRWCSTTGQCRLCTSGYFNCDGKAGCECKDGCDGTKCR